ncbi:MAG: hypothetical protein K2P94_10955 [Rhodospirillaceae bacterium]|nr:hypothetical protein [Rhodospirillaceae bacterium]
MAIEMQFLSLIKQVIDLRRKTKAGELSALCLGYPDLLLTKKGLESLFSADVVAKIPSRADAEKIWAWHGLKDFKQPLYDTMALFAELGVKAEVTDIVAARGMERIVDLNVPLPPDLEDRFDLVIDTGTCEHCFNVAQAFLNSCAALAVGGFLVHAAPLTRVNHGFWNFSPTVYPDFLGDNGFKVHYMSGMICNLAQGFQPFEVQPFNRFSAPADAAIFVVAERLEKRAFKWPVQRKYRSA